MVSEVFHELTTAAFFRSESEPTKEFYPAGASFLNNEPPSPKSPSIFISPCQTAGEEGYAAIDIIRYYYGSDMYINTAESISGVPSSWPGYNLTIGSSGEKVRQMQQQLSRIARNYPAIPTIAADGVFGAKTAEAVRTFQRIFNLPPNGIVDFPTWYSISNIYVGVSRISEPGT